MTNFFLSLKTAVWTLFGLICVFFAGSYLMPAHREIFGPMNDRLLFNWVREAGADNPWQTWWFFAALAGLILLTVNTVVCSLHAIGEKWSRRDFLLRVSPQIIHIGFLFILLGHLLGAGWGYKLSGGIPQGAYARLPEDRTLYLKELRSTADGPMTEWVADVYLFEKGERVKTGTLGPNKPLFYRGAGIYLKGLDFDAGPVGLILVAKDPGAAWALAGGILFTLGSMILLMLKWKKAAD